LASSLDHPGENSHDSYEKAFPRAHAFSVKFSAPAEDVQYRSALPRRAAGNLKETASIRRRHLAAALGDVQRNGLGRRMR
jgi:hypothetical protein